MRRGLAYLAAAGLILAGCGDDRRAGTEVGNPEITMTVSALFNIINNADGVDLRDLTVSIMKMRYTTLADSLPSDTGVCWNRPAGTLANLAQWDSISLPDTAVRAADWSGAEIILRTPEGPLSLPDSADFRTWSDARHAKFYVTTYNNDTLLRALFEMPQGMEIHLSFSQAMTTTWRWGDIMSVPIFFDPGFWAGSLDPRAKWTQRLDGVRRPYVLFSPTENAAAWSGLKARLPESFVADTIKVLQIR